MPTSILSSLFSFWRRPTAPEQTDNILPEFFFWLQPTASEQTDPNLPTPTSDTMLCGHRPRGRSECPVPKRPSKITTTRGRTPLRRTSETRVSQKRRGKKLAGRKPLPSPKKLTPTTETAIAKGKAHFAYLRQHGRYESKRAKEAEVERMLGLDSTYWRVLRNGTRYRSFGGTRPRKFEKAELKYSKSKTYYGRR